jgi:hypothetical protein
MGVLEFRTDPSDPTRVILRGDARSADLKALAAAAAEVLRGSGSVVLSVDDLDAAGPSFVTLLNDLAASVPSGGRPVVLEMPSEGVDGFAVASLSQAVRVERTAPPVVPRTPAAAPRTVVSPTAGAPRREGPGFVTSYGTGRHCSVAGCPTTLSRYNQGDRCAEHRDFRR